MRKLDIAAVVHEDHVQAVMALDYAPTGREFVTGSYDRTVRVFDANQGRSKECYNTKRMQRVFSVKYTLDAAFILSGSDDTNVRMWRARASERLGTKTALEQNAANYREKLKKRFQHAPEVKRIANQKRVPKFIQTSRKRIRIQEQSARRKDDNRRAHSKPGAVPFVSVRKENIVKKID
jgi:WD repeat and SOF domain-containing protein 1